MARAGRRGDAPRASPPDGSSSSPDAGARPLRLAGVPRGRAAAAATRRCSPPGWREGSAACCSSAASGSSSARRSRGSAADRRSRPRRRRRTCHRRHRGVLGLGRVRGVAAAVPPHDRAARHVHRAHRAGAATGSRRSAGPAARASYDFRTALHYVRTTRDGRIAFGAAAARAGLGTGLGPRLRYDERAWRELLTGLRGGGSPRSRDVRFECRVGRADGRDRPAPAVLRHAARRRRALRARVHGRRRRAVPPRRQDPVGARARRGGRVTRRCRSSGSSRSRSRPSRSCRPAPPRAGGDRAQGRGRGRGPPTDPLAEFVARLPRRLGYNLGP